MLTQEQLKNELTYNSITGVFTRAKSNTNSIIKGEISGSLSPDGYLKIMVLAKRYQSHRLAWLYEKGEFPKNHVDHINGIKGDNRICNLRDATSEENNKNSSFSKANKSGYTGVIWHKSSSNWVARIGHKNKKIHLGCFDDINDAVKARRDAEAKYGFHKNHGKKPAKLEGDL